MINKLSSEGLEIIGVKKAIERIEPDFQTDRAPGEDEKFYINSPGVLLIDMEVYVDEENKEKLDEIEATGQPVILEKDVDTEEYVKYSCLIQNEIQWSLYISGNKVYLGAMTLLVQETEGL